MILGLALWATPTLWVHAAGDPGCAGGHRQVLFRFEAPARRVCVSGDFNAWSPETHCLAGAGETWTLRFCLPPGRYRYAFILDGEHWIPDPRAYLQVTDDFGMRNSVLILEE